ncbi:hypothetical protein GCM10009544_37760 [Streptomyces stramineus]|uniref:Uncharacterized protein n=1 Tax=Streptomyces stramineus TaxID=173861 RepID=A0ABN1AB92_9ACTN
MGAPYTAPAAPRSRAPPPCHPPAAEETGEGAHRPAAPAGRPVERPGDPRTPGRPGGSRK